MRYVARLAAVLGVGLALSACFFKPDPPRSIGVASFDVVTLGARHACALDGTALYCWGDNRQGQVGISGVGDYVLVPKRVAPQFAWTTISAGVKHTCGIHDGIVECWGNNDYGQTRGGGSGASTTPMPVIFAPPTLKFQSLAAGAHHTCAIDIDGHLWCWGAKAQIGRDSSVPIQVGTRGDWKAIVAGLYHTCGIAADQVWCFGDNGDGESGPLGTSTVDPTLVGGLVSLHPLRIAASERTTCAILATTAGSSAGELWCWGNNQNNVIISNPTATLMPTRVDTSEAWTDIAVSQGIACGARGGDALCWGRQSAGGFGDGFWDQSASLGDNSIPNIEDIEIAKDTDDGHANEMSCFRTGRDVRCSGQAEHGELGLGYRTIEPVPVRIEPPHDETWQHVWSGNRHTCATTTKGFYCWGADDLGQVDGDVGFGRSAPCSAATLCDYARPTPAPMLAGIPSQVVAARDFTCALTSTSVVCWGDASNGRLGASTPSGHPARAVGGSWTRLVGGPEGTCAFDAGGQPKCWGRIGGTTYETPRAIDAMFDNAPELSSMDGSTCGLSAGGKRVCWGINGTGQLGDGSTTDRAAATIIEGAIDHLAVSGDHGCEIIAGEVRCWGLNQTGETGQPSQSPNQTLTPSSVLDRNMGKLQGCTKLALSSGTSCAICNDKPMCWGNDPVEQLGRGGSDVEWRLATEVALPSGTWIEIAEGQDHGCALDKTKALYCWGDNAHGQVGNGGHAVNYPTAIGSPP